MRKGEILPLTWDKVDLQNRMIRLEACDTKDSEKRSVPICDALYEMLANMPNRIQGSAQDNHVIQYKGKPVKDIRAGLRKACRKAGIKYGRFVKGGFIFHDLRHTSNTYMRKAGVQESVIMEITGHASRDMFDRYNTIDEDIPVRLLTNFRNLSILLTILLTKLVKMIRKKLMPPYRPYIMMVFTERHPVIFNKKRV